MFLRGVGNDGDDERSAAATGMRGGIRARMPAAKSGQAVEASISVCLYK
jgi:hypothetical protein